MRMLPWLLIAGLFLIVSPAAAGLYEDLYRGLDLLATPSGSPISYTADGFQTNGNRQGRLRIVSDRVGRGYTLEFNRRFGVDSTGRAEMLDLGAFELQLDGTLSGTLGYTSRGLFTGTAEVYASSLYYATRLKTGAQDIQVLGTLNVAEQWEINQLGFYTGYATFTNTDSQVLIDGMLVNADDLDTNFDLGPVAVEGNVFYDVAVALLASFGVDTTELEGVFPKSPIDRITDAIQEQLYGQTASVVAGLSLGTDELVGPPSSFGVAVADPLQAQLDVGIDGGSSGNGSTPDLPEPATLTLMAVGAAATLASRRR
jgi:hypothetical protein